MDMLELGEKRIEEIIITKSSKSRKFFKQINLGLVLSDTNF